MWHDSRVFITGGTGMVARHIKKLLESNYAITIEAPDRNSLDLENKREVVRFVSHFKPDFVFHLAGKVHGLGGNLLYPIETLSSNVLINDAVLTACAHDSVKKVFFAGTVASYEYPFASLPLTEERIFYGEPHAGEYGYAVAKRLAYSYLRVLAEKFGKKYVYGAFTNLYGPHDRFNSVSGHVVPSLIAKLYLAANSGEPLQVWGAPDTTRDFLYVEDAAEAAIFLMANGEGIFNISSGVETTMQELVDALVIASNFKGEVFWDVTKPVGIKRRFSSVEKLLSLGFHAQHNLSDGVAKTWLWYRNAAISNHSIRL